MYSTKNRSLPYSREDLLTELNKFSVHSEAGIVTTMSNETTVRTAKVTTQYKVLDIKDFFTRIIDQIGDSMNIESYTISLNKGIQEVSLLSETILINGDEYRKAFYILNSTDRTRALRFHIGLYRADGQRLVIPVPDADIFVRFVHKGKGFNDKIESIFNFVKAFPVISAKQVDILEGLAHQKVSIRKLFERILYPLGVSDDVIAGASNNRAIAFSKQLRVNPTNKINIVKYGISMHDMAELAKPADFMIKSDKDFFINAYQAMQCYHAIYQGRDIGIITHESDRFIKLLAICGTVPDNEMITSKPVVQKQDNVSLQQASIPV